MTDQTPTDDEIENAIDTTGEDVSSKSPPFEDKKSSKKGDGDGFNYFPEGADPSTKARARNDRGADPRWVEAIRLHLDAIEKIELRWRRGASKYKPFGDQSLTVIEGRDEADEALRIAQEMFDRAWKYTYRNGPRLDWQLIIKGREKRSGKLIELEKVAIGINTGQAIEDPAADKLPAESEILSILAHTGQLYREARFTIEDHRHERTALIDANIRLAKAVTDVLDNASSLTANGVEMYQTATDFQRDLITREIQREEARIKAQYDVQKIEVAFRAIEAGKDILSGEAMAIVLQMFASKFGGSDDQTENTPDTLSDAAKELYESITLKQSDILKDAVTDLATCLQTAAKATDDSLAVPPLIAAAAILNEHRAAIEPHLTVRQKALLIFVKGRISVYQNPGA